MTPALVIFDCDGVLVDSEPITNRALAHNLTDHGLPMDTQTCMDTFVGGTIKSVFERARAMGAVLPEDWVERFYDIMCAELATSVEIIPGVEAVLDALDRAGIATCIGSNGPMRKMRITLERTGLWQRFEGRIFSAHDVGIAKPEPGLFLHAANALGVGAAHCAVIEDSASGARAARAAAMTCYGYCAETPEHRLTAHGAIPFDTMRVLPALLGATG